jgi:hypothetical protein
VSSDRPNPPSASSKKAATRLELLFCLPFGPSQPFSEHELVLRGTNPNLKIIEVVSQNNPNKLKAFIKDKFNAVTQLGVEFQLAESISDSMTRLQLGLCLNALLQLADQCAFDIKAEYYGASGPKDTYNFDGDLITCRMTVIARFRLAAGDNEHGDYQKLTILNDDNDESDSS